MFYVTGLALVAGAVIGLARGGRPRFLGQHRLKAWWLVVVGFLLQAATDRLDVGQWGTVLVVAGGLALLVFAALNPNLVGIGVVAVGVAANTLVIGINGAMPVRPSAVVAAHIATKEEEPLLSYGYRHQREGPSDQLVALADIVPLAPFHQVVSVGDLILALGVSATIAGLFRPGPGHRTRSGHPTVLPGRPLVPVAVSPSQPLRVERWSPPVAGPDAEPDAEQKPAPEPAPPPAPTAE
jgi:hypothetical protein